VQPARALAATNAAAFVHFSTERCDDILFLSQTRLKPNRQDETVAPRGKSDEEVDAAGFWYRRIP
jgi:hypothetical protein